MERKWPLYFAESLRVGNRKSNVALCTLWTERDKIADKLGKSYAVAGNLYYIDGINYVIRNVFANPLIRYIILCGADMSGSGSAFLQFMKNGVDKNHRIIGTEFFLDNEIPLTALEEFRRNVSLIDMRSKDAHKIRAEISKLDRLPPFSRPKVFPMSEPSVEEFPTHESGFMARGKTVGSAWLAILRNIMRFGIIKKTQFGSDQKETLNLMAIVEGENIDKPNMEKYFTFSQSDLENYYLGVLTSNRVDASYSYGQRLKDYHGINQIERIIDELKKYDYSRRALAVIWDVENDIKSKSPPCWVALECLVQNGKLFLTAYIRSNDMFAAWPQNAFALLKLQKEIADALNTSVGSLTTISSSAHIYEHDWKKAKSILEKYDAEQRDFDPRGNIVIQLDREKKKS